jgi:hypothetical protein
MSRDDVDALFFGSTVMNRPRKLEECLYPDYFKQYRTRGKENIPSGVAVYRDLNGKTVYRRAGRDALSAVALQSAAP